MPISTCRVSNSNLQKTSWKTVFGPYMTNNLLKCPNTYYSHKFKNFLTIFQVSIYLTLRSEAFSKNRSHLYKSEISFYISETTNKTLSFKFVCFFQYFKRWIKAGICIICGEMFCSKSNSNPHIQVHHTTFSWYL